MKHLFPYLLTLPLLTACFTTSVKQPSNNDFTKVLKKEGFIPYIMPSSLEGPGALISIDNETGSHQWIGDLQSCGFTQWDDIRVVEGNFPKFDGEKKVDFGLNALARLLKFGSGDANANYVKSAKLSIKNAGKKSIDYYALTSIYLDKDKRKMLNPVCLDDLNTGSVRLVGTAAYVKSGKFEFFKDVNSKAKIDASEFSDKVKVEAGFGFKSDGNSAMVFDEVVYIAFKEARKFPTSGTLGPDGKPEWKDATEEVLNILNLDD